MQLSDFQYTLPRDRIAQEPARPRDSARLMLVNRQTGRISHHHIFDLPTLIPPNYFLIANNTKVFPARLTGRKTTGGQVEVLLLTPLGQSQYQCLTKPGLKPGDTVIFSAGLTAAVTHLRGMERTLRFNQEEAALRTTLSELGTMPTPPYIKQLLTHPDDYQTIYAKYGFSAAAPTAGLHFTPSLLKRIKQHHPWLELTLNVGLGTFLPVKTNELKDHPMHTETYTLTSTAAADILELKEQGQLLLSVGTTTLRALESNPKLLPGKGKTSIFIYPPYRFRLADALLTNFHLPDSTLLMLVSAFCSYPNTKAKFTFFENSLLGRAYAEAVRTNYRFFSFGDAMLIL